ncbi:hypothetical protein HX109_09305 [Galbibacter sp. BG1]|uniref:hypothetical protein n=1 Tax=Galbibacter sp. BG1 TaxID=1170699 RepID=UPI0015B91668|nr:hypothetical protein [Galbibacter sp. BG1]QLE01744.1 hypothetical protein HX109_09305 [Galbibacter sp. BG1]
MDLTNEIQNKFHHLSQYLAAFSNSFLPKREDDSQSALLWSISNSALQSQKVERIFLELSYQDFFLRIYNGKDFKELDLLGLTKSGIDSWIRETISDFGLPASNFHYNLGFQLNTDFDTFVAIDNDDEKIILKLIEDRNIAQKILEELKKEFKTTSTVYVWPHHFDTGLLLYTNETRKKGYSLGYSKADNKVCDQPYYYAQAFSDKQIDYTNLEQLTTGQWVFGQWQGAIIPTDRPYDTKTIEEFYRAFIALIKPRF